MHPSVHAKATPGKAALIVAETGETWSDAELDRRSNTDRVVPRHATGKLYKRLLRDQYWGETGSRIV